MQHFKCIWDSTDRERKPALTGRWGEPSIGKDNPEPSLARRHRRPSSILHLHMEIRHRRKDTGESPSQAHDVPCSDFTTCHSKGGGQVSDPTPQPPVLRSIALVHRHTCDAKNQSREESKQVTGITKKYTESCTKSEAETGKGRERRAETREQAQPSLTGGPPPPPPPLQPSSSLHVIPSPEASQQRKSSARWVGVGWVGHLQKSGVHGARCREGESGTEKLTPAQHGDADF
ncbi:hypothetical protein INR49_024342 [Caranx melampygus]|nr:hypothetical protein INR49_024342 [Caranx melampygus]